MIWRTAGVHRVLLVEDDFAVRQALAELLTLEGHAVMSVADGMRALETAHRFRPELVITDLQMPLMRGELLIERLHDAGIDVPVIVITASDLPAPIKATAVLRKPFDVDRLLEILEGTLSPPTLTHNESGNP